MKEAADGMRKKDLSENYNSTTVASTRVSLDGSWQCRSYSYINGIVTAISISKCVDATVIAKYGKGSLVTIIGIGKIITTRFFYCKINHVGSSRCIESGVIQIFFQRSVD